MIVAGFTLHLYCCCADCAAKPAGGAFGEFADRKERGTWRAARLAGWRVDTKNSRAWAPGHLREKTNKPA